MQFKVNGMNQLTNVSRTGSMTVFGALASRTGSETVTVSGTGLSTTPADLYTDAAWASQSGATLADGLNTWTAKIVDYGVTNQQAAPRDRASAGVTVWIKGTPAAGQQLEHNSRCHWHPHGQGCERGREAGQSAGGGLHAQRAQSICLALRAARQPQEE